MNFCDAHWQRLSEQLKQRGIEPILEGGDTEHNPIFLAYQLVTQRMVDREGLAIVSLEKCPVCVLDVPQWLDEAAEQLKLTS